MASPITLTSMIAQATSLADQTNSAFISPTEWIYFINGEASDLYRTIVQGDPDRYIRRNPAYTFPLQTGYLTYSAATAVLFVKGAVLTGGTSGATATIGAFPDQDVGLTAGTIYVSKPVGTFVVGETITGAGGGSAVVSKAYAAPSQFVPLPTDFWLLNRVDYIQSAASPLVFETILAVNLMEEDSHQFTTGSSYGCGMRYRLQNNYLCFVPSPTITGQVQILYTPAYQNLVNGTDTIDDLSSFADVVIIGAAIRALIKENNFQHAASLQSLKDVGLKELARVAQATRDKSTPATTVSLRNKLTGRGGGYRNW